MKGLNDEDRLRSFADSCGRSSNTETLSNLATGTLFTSTSRNEVISGGQIGYNWQASNWLFGLEADFQGSDEKGSSSVLCVACGSGGVDITSTLTGPHQCCGGLFLALHSARRRELQVRRASDRREVLRSIFNSIKPEPGYVPGFRFDNCWL